MPGDGRCRAPRSVRAYRAGIVVFALVFVGLGVALLAVTVARGGGVGYLMGPLFIALGLGRLYLVRRR
jgi:hypothetical protein